MLLSLVSLSLAAGQDLSGLSTGIPPGSILPPPDFQLPEVPPIGGIPDLTLLTPDLSGLGLANGDGVVIGPDSLPSLPAGPGPQIPPGVDIPGLGGLPPAVDTSGIPGIFPPGPEGGLGVGGAACGDALCQASGSYCKSWKFPAVCQGSNEPCGCEGEGQGIGGGPFPAVGGGFPPQSVVNSGSCDQTCADQVGPGSYCKYYKTPSVCHGPGDVPCSC